MIARILPKSVRYTPGNPVGCSGCTTLDPLLGKMLALEREKRIG